MIEPDYTESTASFDDDRIYRYSLLRRWATGPCALWVLLNPSKADEKKLDPTARRCLGFTRSWNGPDDSGRVLVSREGVMGVRRAHAEHVIVQGLPFGAFEIVNLYAFQSKDPNDLWRVGDPVGPGNDAAIQAAAKRADLVMVGWGTNAKPDRERAVAQLLADVGVQPHALRIAKRGSPWHPLYLPETLRPFPWHARGLR